MATDTPTPAPAEPVPAAVDEFADAFASLNTPDTPAIPAPTPAEPVEPAPVPAAEAPKPAEPPAPAPVEPAVLTPAPAAEAPKPAESLAPAPAEDNAALRAEIDALKAKLAAPAPVPAPAAEAPKPAEPPAPVAPVYSEEETTRLDAYRKDWPDIAAGEALLRREEYRQLVGYVFSEVRKQLDPIQQFVGSQGTRTQYTDIVALVPDYDDVRDATLTWIDAQPEYLKAAYKQVTSTGTPADVADLIDRFKRETGYKAKAPSATPAAPAGAPATPAPAAALPAAAAAIAPALRVVKSSRSDQDTPVDANNFDAAFAEFAKS